MRIAHVCPYDYQVSGGVREHVTNLARQHSAMGHAVTIIAPASSREELPGNLVRIPGLVLPIPGSGSIARISLSPLVYPRVERAIREGHFDVVHLHEPLMPAVCLFALMSMGKMRTSGSAAPLAVGTIHGYRESYSIYQLLRPLLRRLMERLAVRIAVSSDARDWAAQYFPGDYHLIPDGVDVSRFADPNLRPMPSLDDGKLNILFVGRLEPRKGFGYLLRAFRSIKRAVPGARLVVAGHFTPEHARPHMEYAREHGLRDVEFAGYVSAANLPRYYKSAHVFCAPSTGFEALGIVLLEAMAAGAPVVTTNIEGYRTVVTPGKDALVVAPKDSTALARAIITLLQSAGLRRQLAACGRETVQPYAWPLLARRIVALYEACIDGHRSSPAG